MASPALERIVEALRKNRAPSGGPPPTIEQQRARMESYARPVAPDVTCTPLEVASRPAEWVSAPGADQGRVILYLHGGGYVIGSINTHREMVGRISRASGARALMLDYRLGPENRFPAAVDDAVAAYRWLVTQGAAPANVVVAGDSAGGGLTVATLLALRDGGDPLPAAGVCISPWVDLEGTGGSMNTKAAEDPMVARQGLVAMARQYLGDADPRHPYASPIHANLAGLPPLLIQVGTAETLLDDSTRLAERAKAAGVQVTLEPWQDMIHVWHTFAGMLPEGQEAIDRIGAFVRARTAAGGPA